MNIAVIDYNHIVLKKICEDLRQSINGENDDYFEIASLKNNEKADLKIIHSGENTYYLFFVGIKEMQVIIPPLQLNLKFDALIINWDFFSYEIVDKNLISTEKSKDCLEIIQKYKDCIKEDCSILIHSYSPNATTYVKSSRKNKVKLLLAGKIKNITYFETSETFRLPSTDEMLWNRILKSDHITLGKREFFKEYAILIKYLINDFINQKLKPSTKHLYSYFNPNSFAFYDRLPLLNKVLPDELNTFNIGILSTELMIGDNKRTYAIDIPYKHYYKSYDVLINDVSSGLQVLFINKDSFAIHCQVSLSERHIYFSNLSECREEVKNAFVSFMPVLSSGLFYTNNFPKIKRDFVSKLDVFNQQEVNANNSGYVYELIYLKHEIKIEEYTKGFIHLCLFREFNIGNSGIKVQNHYKDNLIESFINPVVLPLVEEQLIPDLLIKERQTSKRNQKLDIAAYNISHTFSSNVFPSYEIILGKIHEKICEWDESDNRNNKKLTALNQYFKDQLQKLVRLSTNIAAANDRFNKPVDQAFYSTYNCEELFNEKMARGYFSYIEGSMIRFQNAMSLGICGGSRSCVFSISGGKEKNVLIPYGNIGCTMLMMLISNIFRNLYKHSIYERDAKYNLGDVGGLKLDLEPSDYYKLSCKVLKVDDRDQIFSNEYYKVEIIELSRNFDPKNKYKFENKNISPKEITDELNKRMNDWTMASQDKWKGLKEIRMLASMLIGCPIEEIDFDSKSDIFAHRGRLYPKNLVKYSLAEDPNPNQRGKKNLIHTIYLRKAKLCSIWVDANSLSEIEESCRNEWESKGIQIKVHGNGVSENGCYKYDRPDPLSPVRFVIDCESGAFPMLSMSDRKRKEVSSYKNMHYNFRFMKCNLKDLIDNKEKIENYIKNQWIDGNKYLSQIKSCIYINRRTDTTTTVFGNIGCGEPIAKIDNHFEKFDDYTKSGKVSKDGDTIKWEPYLECNSTECKNDRLSRVKENIEYLQREAVNSQVIIYDEVLLKQVASSCMDPVWRTQKLRDTLLWKGVRFIDKLESEHLNDAFTGENGKATLETLKDNIAKELKKTEDRLTYIIIHYSGFEKILKRSKDELDCAFDMQDANEVFNIGHKYLVYNLNLKGSGKQIVYCSGKYPSVLPEKAYFVDRDTINFHLTKSYSKISLIEQLTSLRIQKYAINEKR